MKTLKKALSIILGLAIMLSCVVGMQVSVAAEGTVALSVGEATVADGVVTVPVVVDSNAGFQSLAVEVSYDNAVLSLVKGEKNTAFTTAADSAVVGPTDANPFRMMWAYALSTENVTATGTIATLTFNLVDETAKTADITLNVTEAWDVAGKEVAATTAEKETVDLVTGPVVDSALKFQGASLGYGNSALEINFRLRNTVLALYDEVKIVISATKYDTTTFNLNAEPTVTVVDPSMLVAAGSTMKSYYYSDIYLYELGLTIEYKLEGYNDGKLVAVSDTFTTSPADYLKNLYSSSSDAKLRTLIADTLVVGDNAAKTFATEGSDLANATSIIEGFDTSEATNSVDSYNTVDLFNSYNTDYTTASAAKHRIMKSVSIGKVPYITLRIKDSGKALDLSKLSFKVAYNKQDLQGNLTAVDQVYTTANADISLIGSYINFKFDAIGLGDSDKDIFFEISYDGEKVCDLTYSIESYLGANMNNASIGNIATALVKIGSAYRAYGAK